jgi:hypothetical protein
MHKACVKIVESLCKTIGQVRFLSPTSTAFVMPGSRGGFHSTLSTTWFTQLLALFTQAFLPIFYRLGLNLYPVSTGSMITINLN